MLSNRIASLEARRERLRGRLDDETRSLEDLVSRAVGEDVKITVEIGP